MCWHQVNDCTAQNRHTQTRQHNKQYEAGNNTYGIHQPMQKNPTHGRYRQQQNNCTLATQGINNGSKHKIGSQIDATECQGINIGFSCYGIITDLKYSFL